MKRAMQWLAGAGVAVAVLAVPLGARAGVITVYPDQLTQSDSTPVLEQSPSTLVAEGKFYKVLNLPVGAIVDRFRVTYSASDIGYDWCTTVLRIKPGGVPESLIGFGRGNMDLPATDTMTEEGFQLGGAPLRVAPGYRYFLEVDPDNTKGGINSVQVIFRR